MSGGEGRARLDGALEELRALHEEVDRAAAALAARHSERMKCRRGCSPCCLDGITVFEIEAERIRRSHGALLEEGEPHEEGACAFLDGEGACRVYESRPYVCRTQGLPLRWFAAGPDGEDAEHRDICPLNDEEGPPLLRLDGDACWLIGPFESRLARLQARADGGEGRRVPLRSLFGGDPGRGGPDRL